MKISKSAVYIASAPHTSCGCMLVERNSQERHTRQLKITTSGEEEAEEEEDVACSGADDDAPAPAARAGSGRPAAEGDVEVLCCCADECAGSISRGCAVNKWHKCVTL